MIDKLVFFVYVYFLTLAESMTIKFGAIFEEGAIMERMAFAHAVESLNGRKDLLPSTKFVPQIFTVPSVDSYQVFQKSVKSVKKKNQVLMNFLFIACDLMSAQVVAIFGPSKEPGTSQVRSVCDAKEIPHMTTSFDFYSSSKSFSFNIFPPARTIGQAVISLVRYYEWTSFVVLHQDPEGLLQLQDLINLSSLPGGPKVRTRPLMKKSTLGERVDYKPVLKHIRDVLREVHIVVQADLETSRLLMEKAKDMSMIRDHYHYIFVNLDLYTLDFEIYKQYGCNITALRLVDINSNLTRAWMDELKTTVEHQGHAAIIPQNGIQTELAVIYDSVQLMARGVKDLRNSLVPSSVSCIDDETWRNGTTFMNFLKHITFEGTTGRIQFGPNGNRFNIALTVVELSNGGFETLGVWNESYGLHVTKNVTQELLDAEEKLEHKMLRVTVLLVNHCKTIDINKLKSIPLCIAFEEDPFVFLKESDDILVGNDRYEGFCIDLLDEIAKLKNFNYTIHEVNDKKYGAEDNNGKWNGLVGELLYNKADLAVSALTINYGRSKVIDFTAPFMHLGISILFRKPKNPEPSLFSFLAPLSPEVWVAMFFAFIFVSLLLWLVARFSPHEWVNPHPCNEDNDVLENQFNLLNSFWYTVGALMQQGSELAPKATSTRLLAGVWWFFTLILISSYTANLAAFLVVERLETQISSADDLVKQTKIKYGALFPGSTSTFFKESKIPTYEKMWQVMSANPSVFAKSSMEGIKKVETEDYAFLMESAMIEYHIERKCDLTQVGGQLDSKGYGIGLQKDSPYREVIEQAVLKLQENTKITALKEKWWKQRRGGGKCVESNSGSNQADELSLKHVGGVFVFLLTGLAAALVIGFIEFLYSSTRSKEQEKDPFCLAMWKDFRFALQCTEEEKHCNRPNNHKLPTPPPPPATGFTDDGHGSLAPFYEFNGYTAVPTNTDSYILPKFDIGD